MITDHDHAGQNVLKLLHFEKKNVLMSYELIKNYIL